MRSWLDGTYSWDRNDKNAALPPKLGVLGDDGIGKVPGENHEVVRMALVDFRGRDDRDVEGRRVKSLFEWTVVHDEVHEFRSDSEMQH